jgi:hypothetical protein
MMARGYTLGLYCERMNEVGNFDTRFMLHLHSTL